MYYHDCDVLLCVRMIRQSLCYLTELEEVFVNPNVFFKLL